MHLAIHDGNVGDSLEKLKELRRVNDGVRDGRFLDQFLLSDLGAKIAAFRQPSVPTTDNAT
jgi:hypothetical protein